HLEKLAIILQQGTCRDFQHSPSPRPSLPSFPANWKSQIFQGNRSLFSPPIRSGTLIAKERSETREDVEKMAYIILAIVYIAVGAWRGFRTA
ncbi:MAG: hypothetical protein WBX49_02935, partial [Candidatus Deferrimicrobiaceae bacterium]